MGSEVWNQLGVVLAAAGIGLVVAIIAGVAVVPLCRRYRFISQESKVGVAAGRTDVVPMGGGFILIIALMVVILWAAFNAKIRWGYVALFALLFLGSAALGLQDDLSKSSGRGLSDKVKLILQAVLLTSFAAVFYWYGTRKTTESDLGVLTIPFAGEVGLRGLYVPFVILFTFGVTNAVNFTDGFNGLAAGVGAVVAVAFAVVTFLAGIFEIAPGQEVGPVLATTSARMFALSTMAAGLAGSLVGYLYYNYHRGTIFFGDTGSMALGAALAFLALFARAEVLMLVIGGVFTAEMLSSGVQRLWQMLVNRFCDPLMLRNIEPTLPFVMAPLHHHFETIMLREKERTNPADGASERARVRRTLVHHAWLLSVVFATIGVASQYARYRDNWPWYNWLCVLGLALIAALLAYGVFTRLRFDCYFIAPALDHPELLALYRGVPLTLRGRRWFEHYQATNIPLDRLGYLERRVAMYRLQTSRVDARTAFGLLHYGLAVQATGEARTEHLQAALAFWDQVPRTRFRKAGRQEVLQHMAQCYRELGHAASSVECLEELYSVSRDEVVLTAIRRAADEAVAEAATAWEQWREAPSAENRDQALHAHEELWTILSSRLERAQDVLARLEDDGSRPANERQEVADEVDSLVEAIEVADGRCVRLRTASVAPGAVRAPEPTEV